MQFAKKEDRNGIWTIQRCLVNYTQAFLIWYDHPFCDRCIFGTKKEYVSEPTLVIKSGTFLYLCEETNDLS